MTFGTTSSESPPRSSQTAAKAAGACSFRIVVLVTPSFRPLWILAPPRLSGSFDRRPDAGPKA